MLPPDDIKTVLAAALRNGGDLAEVYIEDRRSLTLALDDGRLETATRGDDTGGGVRVFYGNTAAYAYTDDLSVDALTQAAQAASAAARGSSEARVAVDLTKRESSVASPIERPYDGMSVQQKADLLREMDAAARDVDPAIVQVAAGYSEMQRRVWIYNSDGVWAEDERSMLEFRMRAVAERNGERQRASSGVGGQVGLELIDQQSPLDLARRKAQSALTLLDAKSAPAGEMTVVISNGWGGVLFHEACGHAMEADFVTKGASAYTGLVGERVANPIISAVDDGTIAGRRGTLKFDDEGTPTQRTVLIEEGILREYMWDLTEARRENRASTGNGRRQSFRHMPMPRMTNTFIDAGPHDPREIIESVEYGLYCKEMGGGQADIARGDFVFQVAEGWIIEKGRLTTPVRGATLVGNGPAVLKQIDMVGHDLALDPGMGMCGKMQSARVSVGQPTVRVPRLTVGGTE